MPWVYFSCNPQYAFFSFKQCKLLLHLKHKLGKYFQACVIIFYFISSMYLLRNTIFRHWNVTPHISTQVLSLFVNRDLKLKVEYTFQGKKWIKISHFFFLLLFVFENLLHWDSMSKTETKIKDPIYTISSYRIRLLKLIRARDKWIVPKVTLFMNCLITITLLFLC